jgi:hypothetical protein
MKEYIVKKIAAPMSMEDKRWEKVSSLCVSEGWDICPSPYKTSVKLVHSDEGIYLLFETDEWPVKITQTEQNSEVCLDSCMEFFFTPNTGDENYFNLEFNAASVSLFGIGKEREGRRDILALSNGVSVATSLSAPAGWKAFVFVPFSVMEKYFSAVENEMRANFCKCGDETRIEHYATWNKIETPEPDYHRPEYFGRLLLTEDEAE